MAENNSNSVEIDSLSVAIENRSVQNAADNLKQLSAGLTELKKAVSGLNLTKAISAFSGLADATNKISTTNVENISMLAMAISDLSKIGKVTTAIPKTLTNQISNLNQAVKDIPEASIKRLSGLATALNYLGSAKMPNISASIGNQLKNIGSAIKTLDDKSYYKVQNLATALQPLTTLGKTQLGSFMTQLAKIPQLAKDFETIDLDKFAKSMKKLADAMKPLAVQMDRIAKGFSSLPSKMKNLVTTSERVNAAVKVSTNEFKKWFDTIERRFNKITSLFSAGVILIALKRLQTFFVDAIKRSNDYIENLNLFNVSMGRFANEAKTYADTVGEAFGIDPSQWMRYQAVVMDMTKSFGVAEDTAHDMSNVLTQLTYDYSSFYNLSVEDAATKIQSALAGEIEPIRRLGKDLSVANLQLIATEMGINKNVDAMTQAEKAMLRTIALVRQSTSAQGDLARTLEQPANQLRIVQAQSEQLYRATGNLLLPILQKTLPYVIGFFKALRRIAEELAGLAGYEAPEFNFDYSESSVSSFGEATDETVESIKELQQLSFDQLNILQSNKSGIVSDISLSNLNQMNEELKKLSEAYDDLWNVEIDDQTTAISDKIYDWIKPLTDGLLELTPAFQGFWDIFKPFAETVGAFVYDKLVEFGEWAEENPEAIETIGEALTIVAGALIAIKGIKWLGELTGITGFLTALVNLLKPTKNVTKAFEKKNKTLEKQTEDTVAETAAVGALVHSLGLAGVAVALASNVFDANPLTVLFENSDFVERVLGSEETATKASENIQETFNAMGEGISETFTIAGETAQEKAEQWSIALQEIFEENGVAITEAQQTAFENVVELYEELGEDTTDMLESLNELFESYGIDLTLTVDETSSSMENSYTTSMTNMQNSTTTALDGISAKMSLFGETTETYIVEPMKKVESEFAESCDNMIAKYDELQTRLHGGSGGTIESNDITQKIESSFDYGKNNNPFESAIKSDTFKASLEYFVKTLGGLLIGSAGAGLLPGYAVGGMPEDGLFFANSSELVGRFSNGRTAVANNDMIIAGIEQGVYKAVTRALQSNSGGSRNIVLDGQVVGKVVDNAIQTERRRSGKLTVTVG